jgi:hypothetical protein
MLQMTVKIDAKKQKKFVCEKCNFKCSKQSNWSKHVLTLKHLKAVDDLQNTSIFDAKNADTSFICDCGKEYKHRQSLYKHKQKCEQPQPIVESLNDIVNPEFIVTLLKQNNELQQQILELCKNNTTNINNSMVNSNNKTFNLNVFLNEQCKDAMNIMEFVDTIKLDLDDAESVKKLGYVNGISNIIIKHLNALDVHMRPVHCTDLKRETMYVKFQDVWEKQDNDNKLIRKAIKHIAVKNYNAAETFKDVHPDCMELESKYGEHFLRLKIEALGGSGNDNYESHTKIIKKIAKEVTIDKYA